MATYSLTLRGLKGSKLTTSELDDNFLYLQDLVSGGGGSSLVELTYAEAVDLVDSEGVIEGTRYLVTGVDVELYGGTDVLIHGLLNNQFSTSGYGKFYNPNYGSMSVWDSSATYSIDGLAIYGGKVWKNLTGSVGDVDNNPFTLDNTNWELQDDYTNTNHYITVWDQIELGFAEGVFCINSRYDSYRNNYVRVGQLDSDGNDRWFFCGVNPIQVFGWGNDNINDCDIKDSYFNCLNIIGTTTIYGVKMSNYSFMFFTSFKDSTIESLNFENESGCFSLDLDNSTFRNCNLDNNSYITGEFNNNSTIENINLSNYSYLDNLNFYGSIFNNINLDNSSYISQILASASYFQNVNMTNESWISDIELEVGAAGSSTIERLDLSNRSYITNVELYNSSMYEIKFDNYSYIQGNPHIVLYNNSYFSYINLDNHSRISQNIGLTGSSYFKRIDMTNRSRIQGPIDFQNNSRIEKIDATNDSYIDNLYFNNNSYIENLDISTSDFQNIGLSASYISNVRAFTSYVENIDIRNNSSLQAMSMDRSYFSNLQIYDNAGLYQTDLNSTYLNLTALGTFSRTFPSGTSFRFGDLKYQFDLTFDGSTGSGVTDNYLVIPAMLIPQYFYIEKVIIESSTLTYSGDSATFSFTMTGGLSPSTLEIAVSAMSDSIKVLDISNGLITGTKADSDKMLVAFLTGGTDITSGGIKMEVTIKNTRYYYD
jgi:hypothetical protein